MDKDVKVSTNTDRLKTNSKAIQKVTDAYVLLRDSGMSSKDSYVFLRHVVDLLQ